MAEPPLFHKTPRKPEGLILAFFAGDTCWPEIRDAPDVAWEAIVQLSRRQLTARQSGLLAAGPLEELLNKHGSAFIERVEREARVYPAFRELLKGVWPPSADGPVWSHFIAILMPPK